MFKKIKVFLKKYQLGRGLICFIKKPFKKYQEYKIAVLWKSIINQNISTENKFEKIYRHKMWGSGESLSGSGSSLVFTENLRIVFPQIIEKYEIKSILDAPCGDLNWMKHLLPRLDVEYIGGDIVKEIVEKNQKSFTKNNAKFIHIDIIKDKLPKSDMMLCRDCLFHFSYKDIMEVIGNFINSEIKYLFLTSHLNANGNHDIKTGDYRLLNFFKPPFNFDSNPLERVDDFIAPEPQRQMCLWDRKQVIKSYEKMSKSSF